MGVRWRAQQAKNQDLEDDAEHARKQGRSSLNPYPLTSYLPGQLTAYRIGIILEPCQTFGRLSIASRALQLESGRLFGMDELVFCLPEKKTMSMLQQTSKGRRAVLFLFRLTVSYLRHGSDLPYPMPPYAT
jgi:hypothetical protein